LLQNGKVKSTGAAVRRPGILVGDEHVIKNYYNAAGQTPIALLATV
jgi:pectate lyase